MFKVFWIPLVSIILLLLLTTTTTTTSYYYYYFGSLVRLLAAELRSTTGPLFLSQCPSGAILLTPYSVVWDRWVSRGGPMLFIGLSYSIPTVVFYYFSVTFLSVYRLVLWGWGLRTDRVYITLSQPCTANLF